jgi:hypothetical protein
VAESGTDDRFGNVERALWLLTAFRADPASSIDGDWFGSEILRLISADDSAMAMGSLINGLLHTSSMLIDALAEELERPGEEVIARLQRKSRVTKAIARPLRSGSPAVPVDVRQRES